MNRWLLCSFTLLLVMGFAITGCAQAGNEKLSEYDASFEVVTGAERLDVYLPLLKGKNVGLIINQTSVVGRWQTSLLDTLLHHKVRVKKVFVPEHGFRGTAAAGEKVDNEKDKKTGLPIISLYGNNKKPTAAQLKNIDVLIYDLQDVGVRFYTYISTLQYAMEACAENDIQLIILDRPNPNGFYVDGPVLDTGHRSFVGMQPIPVVYGMTPGEYAKMLVGEKWFPGAEQLKMEVITCEQYDHKVKYQLPVPPSPNLQTMTAVYCYPSLCFFEGTVISVGRGTDKPFQQWGHPAFKGRATVYFTPVPVWGQKIKPPLAYEDCYGQVVAFNEQEALRILKGRLRPLWLQRAYDWFPDKDKFFNNFFEKLAGTSELRKQVEKGVSETDIQASWEPGLKAFKQIRKKYLLYTDFE